MSEGKCSTLNPLANSFVPVKMTEANTIRWIAETILKKIVEKEGKGEFFTKVELANIVRDLIILKYKDSADVNIGKVNRYLSEKILSTKTSLPENYLTNEKFTCNVNKITFDLSKFQPPKLSFLLVSFWGLYRHEQAERPLLSLSFRPEIVKDKVWSIELTDQYLWNSSCVKIVCQCPPLFGYTIPPGFFGNPFRIPYSCLEQNIHLNHYPECLEGNEFILTNKFNSSVIDEQPFIEDFENKVNIKVDLEELALQFKSVVYELLALLVIYEDIPNDYLEEDMISIMEDVKCIEEESVYNSYTTVTDKSEKEIFHWEDCDIERSDTLYSMKYEEDLEDDSDHPLLEVLDYDVDEGVSKEIEEMIRRSLSPKKPENPLSSAVEFEGVEPIETIICHPPCSVWCSNACKDEVTNEEIKAAPEPASTSDVLNVNLLSPEDLEAAVDSKQEETAQIIDLKPIPNLSSNEIPKRSFRRSLSVNDCDPYYYDARCDFTCTTMQAYSSELFKFKFSGKDAGNSQSFNRSNSWKDTDSGFVSHNSSQEELCDKDCREHEERSSMWGLFSGEDSLWKPLPDCLTQNRSDDKQVTHKRVRDLRRQRSLN